MLIHHGDPKKSIVMGLSPTGETSEPGILAVSCDVQHAILLTRLSVVTTPRLGGTIRWHQKSYLRIKQLTTNQSGALTREEDRCHFGILLAAIGE